MKRVHYTDSYLINPQHPVTVNLIGAGGTGSQVLTCLARLDITLRALGHPGLFVTLYDPDIVTMPDYADKQLLRQRLESLSGHLSGNTERHQARQPGQHHDNLHGQHQVTP